MKLIVFFAMIIGGSMAVKNFKQDGYINFAVRERFQSLINPPVDNYDYGSGWKYIISSSTVGGFYYDFDKVELGWKGLLQMWNGTWWAWVTKYNPVPKQLTILGTIVRLDDDTDWGFLDKKMFYGKLTQPTLAGVEIMMYLHNKHPPH